MNCCHASLSALVKSKAAADDYNIQQSQVIVLIRKCQLKYIKTYCHKQYNWNTLPGVTTGHCKCMKIVIMKVLQNHNNFFLFSAIRKRYPLLLNKMYYILLFLISETSEQGFSII